MNNTVSPPDDEISLVDLVKVLVRRRKTVYSVFVTCMVLGTALALLLPKKYMYSTTLEIGTNIVKDDIRLIDEPETLLAKINESYIPIAQQQYRQKHPDDDKVYELKARIPKKSQIIVIEGKGKESQAEIYKGMQNHVIKLVVNDHARLIEVIRKEIENTIEKDSNKILGLEDNMKLLTAQAKRIDETMELVKQQIKTSKALVEAGIKNRQKASKRVSDETRAMTLLMIDNEIQQNRRRLDELDERLTVTLANQKDQIEKNLADTKRQIKEEQSNHAMAKLQLENLRETHAIVPPIQSIVPVSKRISMMIALVMVFGVFLALASAFVHEFVLNVINLLHS